MSIFDLSQLQIPKALKAGDRVAIISTSWGGASVFPDKYRYGKESLAKNFRLNLIEMPHTTCAPHVLEKHPELRAEDLMDAFRLKDVQGIISTIGGSDSLRTLPHINLKDIRDNCKVYLGYSDSTVTHFMCLNAGIRSYYGPSVMSGFAENGGLIPYMKDNVLKTLFSSDIIGQIPHNQNGYIIKQRSWGKAELLDTPRDLLSTPPLRLLQGQGTVRGRLIGGCMETLEQLKESSLWPDPSVWNNSILFLETSEDTPSPALISEWMNDYGKRGILSRLNGVIVGRPGGHHLTYDDWDNQESAIQEAVSMYSGKHVPVLARLDFGHTDPQIILPYGAIAEINSEAVSFSILEPGAL